MNLEAEMLLEAEHEREITVETLRSLIEEERKERAEIMRAFARLETKIDGLSKAGFTISSPDTKIARLLDITVLKRDSKERIAALTVRAI